MGTLSFLANMSSFCRRVATSSRAAKSPESVMLEGLLTHATTTVPPGVSAMYFSTSSAPMAVTSMPPARECSLWCFREISPRKYATPSASLNDSTSVAYAAAISPLEWLVTAVGKIPHDLNRLTRQSWTATLIGWLRLMSATRVVDSSRRSSSGMRR